ncbi:hypothetical protein SS50377_28526 [Spironucleus salmonicida]|uniref:Uncharacterized protein n=1 Tax=Spironucleus salmonicida TaxID=348837 RepID=V6LD86_9EUKA|nr:hypothetical protein SS50377_28526 [Spironucleus salmonicida]|eukprot:EST41641.1 Hypothetical protein SS50377_19000 [Spironucleus salmonicida]
MAVSGGKLVPEQVSQTIIDQTSINYPAIAQICIGPIRLLTAALSHLAQTQHFIPTPILRACSFVICSALTAQPPPTDFMQAAIVIFLMHYPQEGIRFNMLRYASSTPGHPPPRVSLPSNGTALSLKLQPPVFPSYPDPFVCVQLILRPAHTRRDPKVGCFCEPAPTLCNQYRYIIWILLRSPRAKTISPGKPRNCTFGIPHWSLYGNDQCRIYLVLRCEHLPAVPQHFLSGAREFIGDYGGIGALCHDLPAKRRRKCGGKCPRTW